MSNPANPCTTKNAQHAPGPWTYEPADGVNMGRPDWTIRDASGGYVGTFKSASTTPEQRAAIQPNIALIAAAPDLLAALCRIDELRGSTGGPSSLVAEYQHIARVAIARVEGGAR